MNTTKHDSHGAVAGQVDCHVRRAGSGAKEVRLEWAIAGRAGAGLWRLDSGDWRECLERNAAALCARYGSGTHWVGERDA